MVTRLPLKDDILDSVPALELITRSRVEVLGEEPDWLTGFRRKAMARYDQLGFPSRKLEAWRYIDLRPVVTTAFSPYAAPRAMEAFELSSHYLPEAQSTRLVFMNGCFSPEHSSTGSLPQEVIVTDLLTAAHEHEALLRRYLGQGLAEESDAFSALNAAGFSNGPFVYVPDNTRLEQPIQVLLFSTGSTDGPRSSAVRGVFAAGNQAKLTLFVQSLGFSDRVYLGNNGLELFAGEGAKINHTFLQSEGSGGMGFTSTRAHLAAHSRVSMTLAAMSGDVCRHNVFVSYTGEEAHCDLNGLNVLRGNTQVYNHTEIHHTLPNCTSRQVFKGILDGRTRSEFDGVIVVHRDAQQTDSVQLNKNLLLSEDARVFTRPQLRIDADDVKCAHGATVGQLDPDELFYLASRGISQEVAECILTFGFAEDVVQNIPLPGIRAYLDQLILTNLGQTHSPVTCFATCEECPDGIPVRRD